MADDKKSLLSGRGEELIRSRRERIETKSVGEVRVLERIARDQQEIDAIIADANRGIKEKQEEISAIAARMQELRKLAAEIEKARSHGAEKSFQQGVRTSLGSKSTRESISGYGSSATYVGQAISMASSIPTSELEQRIQQGKQQLVMHDETIRQTAGSISSPGQEKMFAHQMRERERIMETIGLSQSAMTQQKRMGLDLRGQYMGAMDTTERVRKQQELGQISEDVRTGRAGSRKEVEEQLAAVSKKLIDTFARLDEAVKSGSKEADNLAKEFKQLEAQYEKGKSTISEMNRRGVPPGGGGGMFGFDPGKVSGFLSGAGTMAMAGGEIYRQTQITTPLQKMGLQTQFADIANKRFENLYGATQGDMSSLRRVLSDQFAEQSRYAQLMGGKEGTARLLEVGGSGARLAGTGIDAAMDSAGDIKNVAAMAKGAGAGPLGAGMAIGGAVLGGVAKAGGAMAPDAVQFTKLLSEYQNQITQSQTAIQSFQQLGALNDSLSKISDFSSQKAFDYTRDLTLATRGLGVGADATVGGLRTMPGSGQLGANVGEASKLAGVPSRGEQIAEQAQRNITDIIKDPNRVKNITPEDAATLRQGVNQEALQRMKDLSGGLGSMSFMEKAGRMFGLGPSDDELVKRGATARSNRETMAAGIAGMGTTEKTAEAEQGGFFHPLGGIGRVTSQFGHRHHPTLGVNKMHEGTDLATGRASPIHSIAAGKVLSAGYNDASGNFMKVQHEGGLVSSYSHMQERPGFKAGEELARGQQIGVIGSTGRSTGPHLHFGMEKDGKKIDPESIMDLGGGKRETAFPTPFDTRVTGQGASQKEQGLFSFREGTNRRENLQSILQDPAAVQMLARQAGLNLQDIPRVVGQGVGQLGAQLGATDVMRAGQLSRAGYLQSPDQYMQLRGQMTGVGGGAENLEEILKTAVAAGMDTSKNIQEMVAGISGIAARNAAGGVSVFGGAADRFGAATQALRGEGVSENMAAAAAQSAGQFAEQTGEDRGLDIFNVIEFAQLKNKFGKASPAMLQSMAVSTPAEIAALKRAQKEGPEAFKKKRMELGMLGEGGPETAEDVEALGRITQRQITERRRGIGFDFEMEGRIREKEEKGQALTDEEKSFDAMRGRARGLKGVSGTALTAYTDVRRTPAQGALKETPVGFSGAGEEAIAAGAVGDAKVFQSGVENFNKAIGDMRAVGDVMMKAASAIDASKFSESVGTAAGKLTAPLSQFEKGVGNLNTTIENLNKTIEKLNGKVGKGASDPSSNPNHGQGTN